MKIVQINTFPYKATGNIMLNIHKLLLEAGHDSYVCWGRGRKAENDKEITINDKLGLLFHGLYSRIFDKTGFASTRATRRLITKLDIIKPDIVHLHNIHGYYLNIEILFQYLKKNNIKVVWTLHDCWALTGHCTWFDACGCMKWMTGCSHCDQLNTYPCSKLKDNSKNNWDKKKCLFSGLNMTIVTPSEWLADLVKKSYLKEYDARVIYNGVDLNIFKPNVVSKAKEKYDLDNRPIILSVASEWTKRKGLDDIIYLSNMMPEMQFIVVGLNNEQFNKMPNTIKSIKRTDSMRELAELYSIADIFYNPTYEDNFPTTNIEAMACGTPVVTYDTGGSPEALKLGAKEINSNCGYVVKKSSSKTTDLEVVKNILHQCVENGVKEKIKTNSHEIEMFCNYKSRLKEYMEVYSNLL